MQVIIDSFDEEKEGGMERERILWIHETINPSVDIYFLKEKRNM